MSPKVSLNICVGDPLGGKEDSQSFLVDPFLVTSILGSRNLSISSRGIVVAPIDQAPTEIENLSTTKETASFTSYVFPDLPGVDIYPFHFQEKDHRKYAKEILSKHNCSQDDYIFDEVVVTDILGTEVKGKEDKVKCVILMTNVLNYARSAMFIQR